jgi:lipopolysaccharide biosynthesis protein
VSRSVRTLVQELQAYGYQVVVSSACESTEALAWGPDVSTDDLVVIRRPNVGYDFGSWSIGLELVPAAAAADRTILLNDSMAGPFTTLRPLLEAFDATPADVWGLTDTQQFGSHLQSYFLGFRDQVLAERPLARFWADVRHESEKAHVIMRNEIGFSRLLQVEGFVHVPAFSHERVVGHGENPVIRGWKRLLELGFPFLKREILRDPAVAPGGRSAPAVLRRRFGIEVADWVDEELAA